MLHAVKQDLHYTAQPDAELSAEQSAFLNGLRLVAMECRSKRRATLFEACALLQTERSASQEAHAEALMRCLNEALGKPARLHGPGAKQLTFDEAWLVQLGQCACTGDETGLTFLLRSRVAAENRRLVRYLIARTTEHFFAS